MTRFGKLTEPLYLAIIGDLVASRTATGRAGIQRRLIKTLDKLNERLDKHLVAPLAVTAGDEFEGLLKSASDSIAILREITAELRPVAVTFGLGLGSLSTPVPRVRSRRKVAELDGEAFHHARDAIRTARSRNAWAAVGGFDETTTATADSLLELLGAIRGRWKDKQARYARLAHEMPQKAIARRYRVSASVVSESLKAALFEPCQRAEKALECTLSQFG